MENAGLNCYSYLEKTSFQNKAMTRSSLSAAAATTAATALSWQGTIFSGEGGQL
jgi:hypothetical protein